MDPGLLAGQEVTAEVFLVQSLHDNDHRTAGLFVQARDDLRGD